MHKIKIISIISILIAIIVFLFLLIKSISPQTRLLSQSEMRSFINHFVGRELPDKIENHQAIYYNCRGVEELFLSFNTNQEGCSNVVSTFNGQDVRKEEYRQEESEPWGWETGGFSGASLHEKKFGVDLFDRDLLNRVEFEKYPKDSGAIWYLGYSSRGGRYQVLVFEELLLVYIYCGKGTNSNIVQ